MCGSPDPPPSLVTSEGTNKSSGRSERASERVGGRGGAKKTRSTAGQIRQKRKAGVGEQEGSKHLLPLPTAKLGHISHTLSLPASLSPSSATPLSLSLSRVLWPLLLWLQLTPQAAVAKRAVEPSCLHSHSQRSATAVSGVWCGGAVWPRVQREVRVFSAVFFVRTCLLVLCFAFCVRLCEVYVVMVWFGVVWFVC